ncbi:MAG: dihydroorotate dehydrogenase [Candidatus Improbicoccus devescovinae]|nr:MAG: dihydroorotate dehydrogenase [Candidatus Improbicoccus devescovinae]
MDNPIIPASGTFGYGYEFADWYDINILGSLCIKGTTQNPRYGNELPRVAETSSGMINSIGLQNPGVINVLGEEIPKLKKKFSKKIIANIAGSTVDEYVYVAQKFDTCPEVMIMEINVSCPNISLGGMAFGVCAEIIKKLCKILKKCVKKPIYIKLSPNVTNILEIAKIAEDSGADGLVLINCLLGTAINPRNGQFVIHNKLGGFSGPAIKPIALRMIYEVAKHVKIPIIGVGGIKTADDVLEFLSVGACAVEVGSCNLVDPLVCKTIIESLPGQMKKYGIKKLKNIIGRSLKF